MAKGLRLLVVGALAAGLLVAPLEASATPIVDGELRLDRVVFDSGRGQVVRVEVEGAGRRVVRIEIVKRGSGRIVRGFGRVVRLPRSGGERRLRQIWAGRTWAGEVAPAGEYVVRVEWSESGKPGGSPLGDRNRRARGRGSASLRRGRVRAKVLGRFGFRTHLPPVTGETGVRGAVGEFGAGRSGGRWHEGFDILAPCGRRLVAARGGRVTEVGFDPVLYGYFLRIEGLAEPYSYFYSHLIAPPPLRRGQRIRTGAYVGAVGQTGNAATTPCHLHFEVHRQGIPVDPAPFLRAW